jgi:hypothetical protein
VATAGHAKRAHCARRATAKSAGAPGAAVVGSANAGLVSAAAKSAALVNRSAGNLESAFVIAAATCAGTVSRCVVTGGAFSVITLATIACAVLPVYGGSPANISYSIAPREYTSLRASSSRSPIACSGLM